MIWEHEPLEHVSRDGQTNADKHHGFWHDMGTLPDRNQLEGLWLTGKPLGRFGNSCSGVGKKSF